HLRNLVAKAERIVTISKTEDAGRPDAGRGAAPALSARRRRGAAAVGFGRTEAPAALPIHQLEAGAVEQDLKLLARHRPEAGWRGIRRRGLVKRALEPRDEAGIGGLVRPGCAGRRHHAGPELPDDALPDFGMFADAADVKIVQRELACRLLARRPAPLVVTAHAIAIQERALRGRLRLDDGNGLRLSGPGIGTLPGGQGD